MCAAGGDGHVQLSLLQQLCGSGSGRHCGECAVIGGAAQPEGTAGALGTACKPAGRRVPSPITFNMAMFLLQWRSITPLHHTRGHSMLCGPKMQEVKPVCACLR